MPVLGGFEVVGELTVAVLKQILGSAWDNSLIPHNIRIPAGTAFGPYHLADGTVNIPRAGLDLAMDVPVNGVRIALPAQIQVEVTNPPVPSARLFDMSATIVAGVPIGVLPGTIHVAAMLNDITRPNVNASLTSGDPIPGITQNLITEYVHACYQDGTIPHTQTQNGVSLGVFTGDAFLEIFDDSSDPNRRITVSQPTPTSVKVSLPFHLRLSNLVAAIGPSPLSPIGITGGLVLTAPFTQAPGSLTVQFGSATVTVENMTPASGVEGTNFTIDKTAAAAQGINLETLLVSQLQIRGQAIVAAMGNQIFMVPTVAQIETFIADQTFAALRGHGNIELWTPTPPAGGNVSVTDVRPLALPDAIAFCLNNPGGDTSVIVNFIPAARSCAIAIDGAKVLQVIRDQINKPEDQGGFGGLPHTEHNVNGHDAIVKRIDVSLQDGAIHIDGDVTVVDAIAGSIDVDASFSANVGLEWQDNPDGTQRIHPFVIGDPDVDLSLLAWILSFLLGFITLGIVGGIIAIVVMAVAEGVAEQVGGVIVRDQITGQIKGIGAWPQTLEGIGQVTSRFENPILIDANSISFPDGYLVTATYASTVINFADASGPYLVDAGVPVTFNGGPITVDTDYAWDFGDGTTANGRVATHTFADNGLYVAKLTTKVNQPGGVITRQFARVLARNVPPVIEPMPDIIIDEGQEVDFIATFSDQEWPDTHESTFDFGDDSLPVAGELSETNSPPRAQGTTHAKHSYCDNGEFTLTVTVRDDDGGLSVEQCKVTVRNVPPRVDAGEDPYAYPGFPISLEACFTDPGWCDTHTATWDFGDCTPITPAIVRETNQAPAAAGVAAALHVYQDCGTYLARAVVTDDDGGVGEDSLKIQVVRLLNPGFEEGFRQRLDGMVANGWEPYALGKSDRTSSTLFAADEFIVHGGQRAQRVRAGDSSRVGILQQIGANLGWDYQVLAWYHLDERGGGSCRLGIDPLGGIDPSSSAIQWTQAGRDHQEWAQLLQRVTAQQRQITIFLDAQSDNQPAAAYFDDVLLIPYCCQPNPCEPKESTTPPPRQVCVNWQDEKEPRKLPPDYQKSGFGFKSQTSLPLLIAFWGQPSARGKLQFPDHGLLVRLPFEVDRVVAHVFTGGKPIKMEAFDNARQTVGVAQTNGPSSKKVFELVIEGYAISSLLFTGGTNEGLLIDLCIFHGIADSRSNHDK